MENRARRIADHIIEQDYVKVVSHIDADGITAGSIASASLTRAGICHDVEFVKQLDDSAISRLREESSKLIWFTDLGSGMINSLEGLDYIICDHHELPLDQGLEPGHLSVGQRTDLMEFLKVHTAAGADKKDDWRHLNPHLFGKEGSLEISGAGLAYLVSRALSDSNFDLSALAVVGAVGDLQSRKNRRLIGLNRIILKDSLKADVVNVITDINLFGRETRPVHKMLQYSTDPVLPGITGHRNNAVAFLDDLEIIQQSDEGWIRWTELSKDDKKKILSSLAVLLVDKGFGHEPAISLLGEVYELKGEVKNTALHDAKEFSTLLNSCGRYSKPHLGLQVCLGDRGEGLEKALTMLQGHRRRLVDSLKVVREIGIEVMDNIQYFYAGSRIPDGIVGIVATMVLGEDDVDPSKPILGIVDSMDDEGKLKISSRGTTPLVRKGLKLNEVMSRGAMKYQGIGGGHNIAAGATILKENRDDFLSFVDDLIGKQLSD